MESFAELIDTLRKPFLFISKNSFAKLDSVKDIEKRTISLAEKGLSFTNESVKRETLKEIIVLFQGYSSLPSKKRKEIIERSLSMLEVFKTPAAKGKDLDLYRESAHTIPSREKFLERQEKLSARVQFLKGVGPKIASKFGSADICTIDDLLYFFPRRYEDRRRMVKIADLKDGMVATFMGEVDDLHTVYFRGRKRAILEINVKDDTDQITAKWFNFNRSYFEDKVRIGASIIFTGKIKAFRERKEVYHPEFEVLGKNPNDSLSFGRVVPVYSEIGGLYQKTLRKIMYNASRNYSQLKTCVLPPSVCKKYGLLSPAEAIKEIHNPDRFADFLSDEEEAFFKHPCYRSLIFMELFLFNVMIGLKKRNVRSREGIPLDVSEDEISGFLKMLPFNLTKTQRSSLAEITQDLKRSVPMNRLLEGDVGSGKTVIALLSCLIAAKSGFQAAFMAPTEILAEQIYSQTKKLFAKTDLDVELLSGSLNERKRSDILKRLKRGELKMIVGTHALIQEGVSFKDLAVTVVDEQHRFGVMQRSAIKEKGIFPHQLVMSATPIPRTLALTYYGDLDISAIKELPKGRKPIETRVIHDQSRSKLYEFVKGELKSGRQAYIIYPIIEESEKVKLLDATRMAKYLQENIFKEFRLGLIHGRLKSEQKDVIMSDFRSGKIDVLVSTTVIEVGIDVPNATVMIIEHPERFGLSQLHQLRGRVGRGAHKSHCFLVLGIDYGEEIKERLTIFKNTLDGFKLAEEDLKLRGPGDFFGASQHGLPPFRIAKFPRDVEVLRQTREEAFRLLKEDPRLSSKDSSLLLESLKDKWKDKADLIQVG